MAQCIHQAVGQVRLTNVAIVRLKVKRNRFEIACYKNKVINWRNGQETDLDEVLQIDQIFQNVGKGQLAKKKDLIEAFGTDNVDMICRRILDKGELQVSDKERDAVNENKFREIASIVASKCINPSTMRPYPVSTIEAAMKNTIHYAAVSNKSAKQQSLIVIDKLQKHMPIQRAQMLIRVSLPLTSEDEYTEKMKSVPNVTETLTDREGSQYVAQLLINPGAFRDISDIVVSLRGLVDVKEFTVSKNTEVDVEDEKVSHKLHKMHLQTAEDEDNEQSNQGHTKQKASPKSQSNRNTQDSASDSDSALNNLSLEAQRKLHKKNKKKQRKQNRKAELQGEDEESDYEENPPMKQLEPEKGVPASVCKITDSASLDDSQLKCLTCMCGFGNDRNLQRDHYRTDLHRLNLKLKMKELPILSQDEFDLMTPDERDSIMHDYRC